MRTNRTSLSNDKIGSLITLIVGILVVAFSFAFCAPMVTNAYEDRRLLTEGTKTTGVITDVNFRSGARGMDHKGIKVTYRANDKAFYSVWIEEKYYSHREGDRATTTERLMRSPMVVFYDPDKPSRAVIENRESSLTYGWAFFISTILFGALIIWAGLFKTPEEKK